MHHRSLVTESSKEDRSVRETGHPCLQEGEKEKSLRKETFSGGADGRANGAELF